MSGRNELTLGTCRYGGDLYGGVHRPGDGRVVALEVEGIPIAAAGKFDGILLVWSAVSYPRGPWLPIQFKVLLGLVIRNG